MLLYTNTSNVCERRQVFNESPEKRFDSLHMLSIKVNFYFRRKSILPISLEIFDLFTYFS